MANDLQIATIASGLVDSARAGDQNAMAMIARVSSAAKGTNARAIAAKTAIETYIRKNPVKASQSGIGAEGARALSALRDYGASAVLALFILPRSGDAAVNAGVVALANKAPITRDVVSKIAGEITDPAAKQAFAFSVSYSPDEVEKLVARAPDAVRMIAQAGMCLQKAFKIQQVRLPGSSITKFNADIGKELSCPDSVCGGSHAGKGKCGCSR